MNTYTSEKNHRKFRPTTPTGYISITSIKRLAAMHTWKLAVLPKLTIHTIQSVTKKKDEFWFNSTGAAMYCLCKTGDSSIDWHSILKENRRSQNDPDMVGIGCEPKPRTGNAYRYGNLRYYEVGKKVFYTKSDLDDWLAGFISPRVH
jgi:hypothetical protein